MVYMRFALFRKNLAIGQKPIAPPCGGGPPQSAQKSLKKESKNLRKSEFIFAHKSLRNSELIFVHFFLKSALRLYHTH